MLLPIVAYISPLIIGLLIIFLLKTGHRLKRVIITSLIISALFWLITGLLNILSAKSGFSLSITQWLGLGIFYLGYGILISGVFYLLTSLKVFAPVTQVVVSIGALLMNSTVFYANPIIESVAANQQTRQWLIKSVININPMIVIAANFFNHDILRAGKMYAVSVIGPYYQYSYPGWRWVLLVYLVLGLVCFGIGCCAPFRLGGMTDKNDKCQR
ncbi:MAG: hypothetical protein HY762_07265 [Planctomycetes bacterium]|nr:hypothetical protein [Planctomycetota bacterium]